MKEGFKIQIAIKTFQVKHQFKNTNQCSNNKLSGGMYRALCVLLFAASLAFRQEHLVPFILNGRCRRMASSGKLSLLEYS